MPAHRKRGLASSRRRVDDEGEEDDGLDINSDSHSEGSILSGTEDLETSDMSEVDEVEEQELGKDTTAGANEEAHAPITTSEESVVIEAASSGEKAAEQQPSFAHTADTEAMMNGLKLEEGAADEEPIHFEEQGNLVEEATQAEDVTAVVVPEGPRQRESLGQRRAREHEEYKAKREADPAFVPNRGGFFMHDQRHNQFGPGLQAQMGRGRGRGMPVVGAMRPQPPRPAMDKWTHDLHETVVAPRPVEPKPQPPVAHRQQSTLPPPKFPSKTNVLGNVMLKISLPGKKQNEKSVKMTARQHTRLPDLRPPLRRDKPVRIYLPGHNARYVFPSVERSFIFIPRAQRPSHTVGRPQSRVYSTHSGDRRQSMLNGSIYAPSAASRRSSVLQEYTPTSESETMNLPQAVVNLPINNATPSTFDMNGVAHLLPAMQEYPPPAQPLRHEARRTSLPMHQPRPQKQVSLATIDSPSAMQAPQTQEQVPFHQQVPNHVNGASSTEATMDRQQSFQGQLPAMTPLSSIPEVAINAQPFQPGPAPQQEYYPAQYPLQYYYQQHDVGHAQYPTLGYDPQGGYYVPLAPHGPGQAMEATGISSESPYMHESNGMVYYYDPSLYAGGANEQGFTMSQQFANDAYSYGQNQPTMGYYPTQ